MKLGKMSAGQFEGAPNPLRGRILTLDLNFFDHTTVIGNDGIKQLGPRDRKKQKRKLIIRQELKAIDWKPDGIWQSHEHLVFRTYKRECAEQRIAQACGILLHCVANRSVADARAEITDNVGFLGGNDKTHAINSGCHHEI